MIGHESIRSASRMNSAMVLFLDSVDKVNKIVEQGIVVKDAHTPVFPLVNPSKKITLSNVPPFIKDDILERELLRYGQLVLAIKRIPIGCKSPLLKHVVSFRRHVFMVLKQGVEELNVSFKFTIDGFDYVIFVTTETMKCFNCKREGHMVRACPEKVREQELDLRETQSSMPNAVIENEVIEDEQNESRIEMNIVEPDVQEKKNEVKEKAVKEVEEIVSEQELMEKAEPTFKLPNTKRKATKSALSEKNLKRGNVKEQVEMKDMYKTDASSEMEYSLESDSEK